MVAEFAHYQSWIAWVAPVALLAVPLTLRRIPPLCLALVGSFVGSVWVSLAPPLGRNAEQLGPELAIGLGVGAIVGAMLGLIVRAVRRTSDPDASTIAFGWAVALGIVGALIGAFGPSLIDGPPDLEIDTLFSTAVGGGLGWIAGAVVGWRLATKAPMPNAFQRSLLVVAALSIAMMGTAIVVSILGRQFGPSIDELTRHERHEIPTLAALYALNTAIVTLTVLILAVRRPRTAAATIPAPVSFS